MLTQPCETLRTPWSPTDQGAALSGDPVRARVLVAYATKLGSNAEIAARLVIAQGTAEPKGRRRAPASQPKPKAKRPEKTPELTARAEWTRELPAGPAGQDGYVADSFVFGLEHP